MAVDERITAHTFAPTPSTREAVMRATRAAAERRQAPEAVHAHHSGLPCREGCVRVDPDGMVSSLVQFRAVDPVPTRLPLPASDWPRIGEPPSRHPERGDDWRMGWGG